MELEKPHNQPFNDTYRLIERIGGNMVIARRRSLDHSSPNMGIENQIVANASVAMHLEQAAKKLNNLTTPKAEAPQLKQVFNINSGK